MIKQRNLARALCTAMALVLTAAPTALAEDPVREGGYDSDCDGVSVMCCQTPAANESEGACSPTGECLLYVEDGGCVDRPLPPDGECGGNVLHPPCEHCTVRNETNECQSYQECAAWVPVNLAAETCVKRL